MNLACLLASGARWILFINTLSDLELQSRLLMSFSDLPSTHHHRLPRPCPFLSYLINLMYLTEEILGKVTLTTKALSLAGASAYPAHAQPFQMTFYFPFNPTLRPLPCSLGQCPWALSIEPSCEASAL